MERNANDTFGNQNTNTSAGVSGTTGGSDASVARDATGESAGLKDRAASIATATGERLGNAASSARERAGSLKDSLADALESGAERLRQQGGTGQVAAAGAEGMADTLAGDSRLTQTSNQVAGGLQASADWLRDVDVEGMKSGIERQVKEHPGRTLAIAVGLGYLLGKALRK